MAYVQGSPLRRIEVEFVEADVEIGFSLIDLAREEWQRGHTATVARVLHDTDDVLRDIEQRLCRLQNIDRACFGPLVAELFREVELVRTSISRPESA